MQCCMYVRYGLDPYMSHIDGFTALSAGPLVLFTRKNKVPKGFPPTTFYDTQFFPRLIWWHLFAIAQHGVRYGSCHFAIREERRINTVSTDNYLWYIVLPSTLTSGNSYHAIIQPRGEVWLSPCLTYHHTGVRRKDTLSPSRLGSLWSQYGWSLSALAGLLVYDDMLMTSDDSLINYRP